MIIILPFLIPIQFSLRSAPTSQRFSELDAEKLFFGTIGVQRYSECRKKL